MMINKKWIYRIAAVIIALAVVGLLLSDEASRARLPGMVLSIGVSLGLIIGVICLAYFFTNKHRSKEEAFRKRAVPVSGKVTKVERVRMVKSQSVFSVGDEMYMLRAEYDYEGKHYTKARRSYFGEPPYKVGDEIIIYVNPANPAESKILADEKSAEIEK